MGYRKSVTLPASKRDTFRTLRGAAIVEKESDESSRKIIRSKRPGPKKVSTATNQGKVIDWGYSERIR